jgi:hypothetical protein
MIFLIPTTLYTKLVDKIVGELGRLSRVDTATPCVMPRLEGKHSPGGAQEMPDIVFRNLARTNAKFDKLVKDFFGWSACKHNSDWVVPKSCIHKNPPCQKPLSVSTEIDLRQKSYGTIAKEITEKLPNQYDRARVQKPSSATITGDLGLISRLRSASLHFLLDDLHVLKPSLEKEIIPLLYNNFNVNRAVIIKADADQLQGTISFFKIALLLDKFGINEAQQLSNTGVLRDVMGSPIDVVSFPSAFTFFGSWGLTLPLYRPGAAVHFYGDDAIQIPFEFLTGGISNFAPSLNPLTEEGILDIAAPLKEVRCGEYLWNYIKEITTHVNSLYKYISDPRNFSDQYGNAQLLKQIQAYSGIMLLFSDLQGASSSRGNHQKVMLAHAALDKIANLRYELGGNVGKEAVFARELPSFDQYRWILRNIDSHQYLCSTHKEILKHFADSIVRVHRDMRPYGRRETDRLKRLREFRNLLHGTFLKRDQFSNLFLENNGKIPDDFVDLPFLLALGLLLSPKEFLEFCPSGRLR